MPRTGGLLVLHDIADEAARDSLGTLLLVAGKGVEVQWLDERRVDLDAALLGGELTRIVAERFDGLSYPQVKGHRRSAHHLQQTPRRGTTGPHDAASLLRRIEANLDDAEALAALRIAASALPPAEKRLFIAALRSRAGRGKVAEPVEEAA